MTRTAIVDIGTNTVLLLIVERRADGSLAPLVDDCRFGKLGRGLDATGRLDPRSIETALAICAEYRRAIDAHGVARTIVIATQAAREASNARDFVGPAEAILGVPIEVIGGAREAELAFRAVAGTFPELAGTAYVVVDVGGGSTEYVATRDGRTVAFARSLRIGARRMTERHLAHDPPRADELAALAADLDAELAAIAGELPRGVPVIGTAGTATTIAAIELGLAEHDPVRVTGARVAAATVDAQLARLAALDTAGRAAIAGVAPERADVIVGGVAVYARTLHALAAPTLITCDRGIRWGLAYELAR